MAFINYTMNDEDQNDLVIGTNLSTLGIIRNYQYIKCELISHKNMINCIKCFSVNNQIFVASAGEDKVINVFDLTFNLVIQINLETLTKRKNTNFAIQSFDIYSCKNKVSMLIGTKGGEILELEVEFEQNIDQKNFAKVVECNSLIKNHAAANIDRSKNNTDFFNYKKVFISVHPKANILVSCGDDCILYFWDTINCKPILIKTLGFIPTTCKFSPDGNQLVIGFQNGFVMIFEPKITRSTP